MSSLHTLQAVVTGSFLIAVGLNLWVQKRRGIRAFVLSAQPGKRLAEVISIGGLFGWFALVGLEGVAWIRGWLGTVWIDSGLADAAGAALMLGGWIVGLLAYLHMGRSWRIGIDEGSSEKLVTHGVFAWSRNPIYLFIDSLALGVLLASGSAFFVISSPLVLIGVHLRVLEEERFLAGRYGEEFDSYCARTKRYFGRRLSGGGVATLLLLFGLSSCVAVRYSPDLDDELTEAGLRLLATTSVVIEDSDNWRNVVDPKLAREVESPSAGVRIMRNVRKRSPSYNPLLNLLTLYVIPYATHRGYVFSALTHAGGAWEYVELEYSVDTLGGWFAPLYWLSSDYEMPERGDADESASRRAFYTVVNRLAAEQAAKVTPSE